jgi:hypothetical protein
MPFILAWAVMDSCLFHCNDESTLPERPVGSYAAERQVGGDKKM